MHIRKREDYSMQSKKVAVRVLTALMIAMSAAAATTACSPQSLSPNQWSPDNG
jgi:hypothetical protein